MAEIETKLRAGMTANGIVGATQDEIIQSITSFALYGFPESHAASFALIAYASAYLKCHYLAAFTAAILNNQPMGFYSPATLVKDAQRHGLKVRPIDVMQSNWECTLEPGPKENFSMRVGLRYVHGLHESAGRALVSARNERPFTSIDDLVLRVPALQKNELVQLADIGALNFLDPVRRRHRRDALWQVERAAQRTGPLLETLEPGEESSPLDVMTPEERLVADFNGTGITIGPHPMAYRREELSPHGILRASDLAGVPNGRLVRVAGCVIARQRPGTAKGFVFLSLEDETGIANIIVTPDVLDRNRATIIQGKFLLFEGPLQNVDNVIHVKAARVEEIAVLHAAPPSRDFH
jgi:error-prone DNA polymerase